MLIDTHAHVSCKQLLDEKEQILNGLCDDGVGLIVCPSYDEETNIETLKLVDEQKRVFGALGIHPSEEKVYTQKMLDFVDKNLQNDKIVALGEIGLDYHYENVNKKAQQKLMIEQMEIAKANKVPIIFHVRDAFDDFFKVISENKSLIDYGADIHCFLGDEDCAKKAYLYNMHLSVTGALTYKKNVAVHNAIKNFPLDMLMLETDSPYLAPQAVRGQKCVPDFVKYVCDFVAMLKNISEKQVEDITTNNALNFYFKMGKLWKKM